jgi:HD superfamily phosphodiesterase
VPAAILHDIGRARAGDEDHGVAGQELAAELMEDIGLPGAVKERILELIEHHHDRDRMDSAEGAALFDADLIVNLGEAGQKDALRRLTEQALSEPGRRIGERSLTS